MKRVIRFFRRVWQKITRGFSDADLWNLGETIAVFTLPRLIEFSKYSHGYPCHLDKKQWEVILKKIIYGLLLMVDDDNDLPRTARKYKIKLPIALIKADCRKRQGIIEEGTKLLGEYLEGLWD